MYVVRIQVDMASVANTGMILKNKAFEYDQAIQKIYMRMHEMQSFWQGKDNQAFINQLEGFQPQLKKMTHVIEQYGNYLQSSASQYEQLQQERANAASRLA